MIFEFGNRLLQQPPPPFNCRAEEAGVPVPDELCQVPARHGHHGGQHLCQGLRGKELKCATDQRAGSQSGWIRILLARSDIKGVKFMDKEIFFS